MRTRPLTTTLGAVALSALAACATSPRPSDVYGPGPEPVTIYGPGPEPVTTYARSAPYSDYGVVRAIDIVPVSARPAGAGAILGAIVGGVVGNQFGSGSGRALTTIGGAVAGGVAGNAIQNRARRDDEVYRVSVRFEDGSIRDFDYQQIGDLRVGDRVQLADGQLHFVR